ncbi:MAG TPA: alpha/beta hydrolase [Xanthobacteraceae bacterium]|nr:alpha/beta hydrolase [Xanthobacteraceae bacterium]
MGSGDLRGLVERPGANDVPYEDPYLPGRPLLLRAARPHRYAPDTPVLFVHHGVRRNGGDYRDYWLPLVDAAQLLVIVPEFSSSAFPEAAWYNFGNRVDEDGRPKPRTEWTYGVPERVFAALRQQGVTSARRYGSFGHSAGGQFVHRMVSLGFRDRISLAATANAGTYAMPDRGVAFPYGLGDTDVDDPALRALLAFRLMIFAGTADIDTASEHFPRNEQAMRQGPTRYARAHAYLAAAQEAARARNIACNWTITEVPDVGHDGEKMSAAAAPILAAALHEAER